MRKTILLVDDNIANLRIGKNALRDTYDVLTVSTAQKALYFLEKRNFDLILLDIDMPVMDGYETIRLIKSNQSISHIPVIFLTARDDAASRHKGLSLGAADYILKPFSIPLLLESIERHMLVEVL